MPATAAAAATTDGSRCDRGRTRRSLRTELDGEVDDDVARVAGDVVDADLVAVALLDLVEQRQRVVVIDEAHDLAVLERLERTEDGGMAETLGNATRIKRVNSSVGHRDFFHRMGSGLVLRPESQPAQLRRGVVPNP